MSEAIVQLGLPELPEPLPVQVPDSHTHLDATREFSGLEVADSLAAASLVNVSRVVQIGCDVESSEFGVRAAAQYQQVVAAVAIHPNEAARIALSEGIEALDRAICRIDQLAASSGVRAVGETGLDYYRTREEEGRTAQRHSFISHIETAVRHGRTLVIHDRDAHDDILDVLSTNQTPERIIMHCFSGDAAFARKCLDQGAWLSFPGVLTYRNAPNLREALKVVPLEKLLVETDAPYLTPTPHRGRANAPYLLPHTVRYMADQLNLDLVELCETLSANTDQAYGGGWGG